MVFRRERWKLLSSSSCLLPHVDLTASPTLKNQIFSIACSANKRVFKIGELVREVRLVSLNHGGNKGKQFQPRQTHQW